MTVSTQTNKVTYIGNGIAKEFTIPFPFLENEHICVFQLLNDIQTVRTDYVITKTANEGTVTFETAPSSGTQIVILRKIPLTQETDYRENEIFPAETHERALDKLTMQIQQLAEKQERSVTVDIFDDTAAEELIPSIRASVSDAANYADIATKASQAAESSVQSAMGLQHIATDEEFASGTAINRVPNVLQTQTKLEKKVNKYVQGIISPDNPAYVVETYCFGHDWYRIWSDGWIEQGGRIDPPGGNGIKMVNFLKPFFSIDFNLMVGFEGGPTSKENYGAFGHRTTTAFEMFVYWDIYPNWYACGY